MKTQVWLGQKSLRFWYFRYKDSAYYHLSIICIIVVVSFLLIVKLILPQVQSWFSIRDEVIATNDKLTVIRNNINLVNNLDKNLLTSQVQTASLALPPQQDFTNILTALSHAAIIAHVSINDFSFQISGAAISSRGTNVTGGAKAVQLVMSVNGTADTVKSFIQTLGQELPISNVVKIDFSGQVATITLEFYQKAFSTAQFNPETPILPLPDTKSALLQKLSGWQQATAGKSTLQVPVSSNSGVPLF